MACKFKNCNDNELLGYKYCEKHLCPITQKGNLKCKKPIFNNSHFCWWHHYSINKTATFITIITIISFLFNIYLLPPLQNYLYGDLKIDFKENDITLTEDGKPAVKIEVLNRLGKDLYFVNGTATLVCGDLNQEIKSKTFKLERGHDFLGDGSSAEFLLSPDQFFVDLIKSRNNKCADAYFITANYYKVNNSYAKLYDAQSYFIFIDNKRNFNIINENFSNINDSTFYNCVKCEVIINISSLNNKPFIDKESHKFVSGKHNLTSFPKEIFLGKNSNEYSDAFSATYSGYYPLITNHNELCNKINEKYKTYINCNQPVISMFITTPIFTDTKFYLKNKKI